MKLLMVKPLTSNVYGEVEALYECDSCLNAAVHNMGGYSVPDKIRCQDCGYYEGE